jgi:DHA2 family multidrug resistance protein
MITKAMIAKGADPWTAKQRALALMDRQILAQASVLSYSKIYMLSAVLILSLIPLLLLVRQTKSAGGAHAIME